MNKSVTVRSEERAIYTHSRNLTVQIYVESFDVDLGTFDLNRKYCSQLGQSHYEQVNGRESQRTSGLSTRAVSEPAKVQVSGLLTIRS